MRTRLSLLFASPALTVSLALVLVQGFHELEHVAQVVQRTVLRIPNGNGLIGSVADIEPVHFVYNSLYLALLAAVFLLLGLHREGPSEHGRLVAGLVTFAAAFQMWHELEHVFKLTQYLALGVNGTGGILGQGPGAIAPLFPIPILHLAYNTAAYLPALAAFAVLASGRKHVGDGARGLLKPRRSNSQGTGAACSTSSENAKASGGAHATSLHS